MKGLIMLPAGATNTAEADALIRSAIAAAWGADYSIELEDSKTAWDSLLYLTGGKFPAYFSEVTRGTDSDQRPLYSCGFVVDYIIGKGTADLISRFIEVGKPVYYIRPAGTVHAVRNIYKVKHDMKRGWRVLYDGQSCDELEDIPPV